MRRQANRSRALAFLRRRASTSFTRAPRRGARLIITFYVGEHFIRDFWSGAPRGSQNLSVDGRANFVPMSVAAYAPTGQWETRSSFFLRRRASTSFTRAPRRGARLILPFYVGEKFIRDFFFVISVGRSNGSQNLSVD